MFCADSLVLGWVSGGIATVGHGSLPVGEESCGGGSREGDVRRRILPGSRNWYSAEYERVRFVAAMKIFEIRNAKSLIVRSNGIRKQQTKETNARHSV